LGDVDELAIIGAYLWDQMGKHPATAQAMEQALIDAHWFKPSEAKAVVAALISSEFLFREGENLTGSSILSGVEIPRGFHPSPGFTEDLGKARQPPLLDRILSAAAQSGDKASIEEIAAETKRTKLELGLTLEGAALLVAWRHGVRKADLIAEFLSSLKTDRPNDET
jgi:hypothetical protein